MIDIICNYLNDLFDHSYLYAWVFQFAWFAPWAPLSTSLSDVNPAALNGMDACVVQYMFREQLGRFLGRPAVTFVIMPVYTYRSPFPFHLLYCRPRWRPSRPTPLYVWWKYVGILMWPICRQDLNSITDLQVKIFWMKEFLRFSHKWHGFFECFFTTFDYGFRPCVFCEWAWKMKITS